MGAYNYRRFRPRYYDLVRFAAGCDYFVPKPFDLAQLLLVVETALVRTNPLADEAGDRAPAERVP